MDWYLMALKKYADFSGRSQRKEYWMFTLFNLLASFLLALLGTMLGLEGFLQGLYSLAVLLPSIAVTVRRLHDIGKSGWWVLILLVPLIGVLVMLYFAVQDSEPGANAYGPNPKTLPAL